MKQIYIKSQTFQDHQTSRGQQFNWHFSIYISEHFTPLNAIKYKIHMDHSILIITDILDNYIDLLQQTFRGTQFNLNTFRFTHFIKTFIDSLLASKRNQIYSEASSTRFSAINLLYFMFTDETPHGSTSNHRHFRTTRLLADNNSIDTFRFIYQNTLHL